MRRSGDASAGRAERKEERRKEREQRKQSKKNKENTQKGRGKRARQAIHEPPRQTPQKKVVKTDVGPPLRISGGSSRKPVTGISPETVVRNSRKGGRRRWQARKWRRRGSSARSTG